jgi:outer membrane protein OmpA-like peptidoglycan-associated protein
MDSLTLEVCPKCNKKAAPQFMWHYDDGTWLCLECYHKEKNAKPVKREEVQSTLKSESKTAGYAMKAAGSFLGILVVVVVSLCLFYKPHSAEPLAKADKTEKTDKPAQDKAKPADDETVPDDTAKKDDKSDDLQDGKPVDEAAVKKNADVVSSKLIAVAGAKKDSSKDERVAPTVQALTSEMPQTQGQHHQDAHPTVISEFVDKANEAANAIQGGPGTASPTQLKPNGETKAKVQETQAAVMATASALIQKADSDGTKTADALAKLGSVSSAFAEVASQLAPPAPLQNTKGGGGGLGNIDGSTTHSGGKLEGDVLAAQGRAGYDPMDAVRRETQEGGQPDSAAIAVQKDPHAPKPDPGTDAPKTEAAAIRSAGIVERTAAVTTAGLPAAFAAAAQDQQAGSAGVAGVDPNAGPYAAANGVASSSSAAMTATPGAPQQLAVTVMSLGSDVLFDTNSAALRSAAEAQLTQIARVLSSHSDLPVLIRGYTDSKGSVAANRTLSRKRAEAVREWLVAHVSNKAQNITVQGFGAASPLVPNTNPDGSDNPTARQKNRRVTVTIPQHRELVPAPQLRATQPAPQPGIPSAQAQPPHQVQPQPAQVQSQLSAQARPL